MIGKIIRPKKVYLCCEINVDKDDIYEDKLNILNYNVMSAKKTKKEAEKFLREGIDYLKEYIHYMSHYEFDTKTMKGSYVPYYTDELGEPKPKFIQLQDRHAHDFKAVTFKNYPEFVYGYCMVELW